MTTTTGTPLAEQGAGAAASEMSVGRTRKRYIVLAMLFLVTTINYADRATLSIAGPALSKEMGLDAVTMGYVF